MFLSAGYPSASGPRWLLPADVEGAAAGRDALSWRVISGAAIGWTIAKWTADLSHAAYGVIAAVCTVVRDSSHSCTAKQKLSAGNANGVAASPWQQASTRSVILDGWIERVVRWHGKYICAVDTVLTFKNDFLTGIGNTPGSHCFCFIDPPVYTLRRSPSLTANKGAVFTKCVTSTWLWKTPFMQLLLVEKYILVTCHC